MEITFDWQKPIQLTKNRKIIVDKDELPQSIEERPGVYFFSRRFGNACVPFYIGETQNLRHRLKDHLGAARIVLVLLGIDNGDEVIKNGTRFFHYAYFVGRGRQSSIKCRRIVQKYLIREAVRLKYPILNEHLTTVKTNTLLFEGSALARGIYDARSLVEE
jgi:hypothetical protein